jgi:hypothetical protein
VSSNIEPSNQGVACVHGTARHARRVTRAGAAAAAADTGVGAGAGARASGGAGAAVAMGGTTVTGLMDSGSLRMPRRRRHGRGMHR